MTTDGVAVGVDVGGTKILATAIGRTGTAPIGDCRLSTPATAQDLVDAIEEAAVTAAAEAGGAIGAIGVGVPGLVDHNGVMRFAANLRGITELPLRALLADRLGVQAVVDNDANVAAWGERVAGAGDGCNNMLMVTIGTGIGGGIVLDGALYRGAHGMAGEIGHIVVQLDGEQCQCGQRGCWERYASGSALGRVARAAGFASGEDVVTKAAAGDIAAIEAMNTFTRWMAIGIAALVNVLDPEIIVIGGGLVEAGDLLLTPLRDWLDRLIEGSEHRPSVPLALATLGERAGAIGAALLARAL
ncbi:MAG TPA: ROK family protein [Acidimicrobiales bacterium]|nr:ROK family protein [Acidimicrobiales bacterium]